MKADNLPRYRYHDSIPIEQLTDKQLQEELDFLNQSINSTTVSATFEVAQKGAIRKAEALPSWRNHRDDVRREATKRGLVLIERVNFQGEDRKPTL